MSIVELLPGLFYDKGGAFYNVKHPDIGAKGDNSNDDGAAFIVGRDLVSGAGGGVLVVPPGTYKQTTAFVWGSATNVVLLLLPGAIVNTNPLPGFDDDNVVIDLGSLEWPPIEKDITASTTQAQGERPLTKNINIVDTVANANDVVTLPAARTGRFCFVKNNGANSLNVYAASGDQVNGASAQAIAVPKGILFIAESDSDWFSFSQ